MISTLIVIAVGLVFYWKIVSRRISQDNYRRRSDVDSN
jgi:hypothetical protein